MHTSLHIHVYPFFLFVLRHPSSPYVLFLSQPFLSPRLPLCLSVCLCLSLSLSVCLSVCLCLSLSLSLSLSPTPLSPLSHSPPPPLSLSSFFVFFFVFSLLTYFYSVSSYPNLSSLLDCLCLSVCLSLPLSVSVCLSVSLSLSPTPLSPLSHPPPLSLSSFFVFFFLFSLLTYFYSISSWPAFSSRTRRTVVTAFTQLQTQPAIHDRRKRPGSVPPTVHQHVPGSWCRQSSPDPLFHFSCGKQRQEAGYMPPHASPMWSEQN